MRVLVIGHPETVLGFSLVGIQGQTASNADEANRALDEALAAPDVGIVLITMDVADQIEARMAELKMHSTVPLIVEIPGPQGVQPGQPTLSEIVQRASGVKL